MEKNYPVLAKKTKEKNVIWLINKDAPKGNKIPNFLSLPLNTQEDISQNIKGQPE